MSRRYVALCTLVLLVVGMLVGTAAAITSTIYSADSADGGIFNQTHNSTVAILRSSPGSGGDYGRPIGAFVRSDLETNTVYEVRRGVVWFSGDNASIPIPDDATIYSLSLKLFTENRNFDMGSTTIVIVPFTIDGTISAGDFDNFGTVPYMAEIPVGSLTANDNYTFQLNSAAIANFSKTSTTGFGVLCGLDKNATEPAWVAGGSKYAGASFSQADTLDKKPMLTVVWVNATPTAGFTVSVEDGVAPLAVTFTDTSSQAITYNYTIKDTNGVETNIGTTASPSYTFTSPGVYTVNQTVTNPLGSDSATVTIDVRPTGYYTVKILDTIIQGEYPNGTAIVSGTAGTDDRNVFLVTVGNMSNNEKLALNGNIITTAQTSINNKDIEITNYGNATWKFNPVFTDPEDIKYALWFEGTLASYPHALAHDAAIGDTILFVTNSSGFTTDNDIIISDDRDFDTSQGARDHGEQHKILAVNGNAITIEDPLEGDYLNSSNAAISLITPVSVNISNILIYSTNNATDPGVGIGLYKTRDSKVTGVSIHDIGTAAVAMYMSIHNIVENCHFDRNNQSGYGYGVEFGDSTADSIVRCTTITNGRHAITNGIAGGLGMPRGNWVDKVNASQNYHNVGTIDSHAAAWSFKLTNSTIENLWFADTDSAYTVTVGVRNFTMIGNNVTNSSGIIPRSHLNGGVITGSTWDIEYNQFVNNGLYLSTNNGYIWDLVIFKHNTFGADPHAKGQIMLGSQANIKSLDTDVLYPIVDPYTATYVNGTEPVTVTYHANPYSFIKADNYTWCVVNQTPGNNTAVCFSTASSGTINLSYGIWILSHSATNEKGSNVSSVKYYVNVSASDGLIAPLAMFTQSKIRVRIPQSVTMTDTSTNTPTSWQWSWGDRSANSTTQNPSHIYRRSGVFTITLTAINDAGQSSNTSRIYVTGGNNPYRLSLTPDCFDILTLSFSREINEYERTTTLEKIKALC